MEFTARGWWSGLSPFWVSQLVTDWNGSQITVSCDRRQVHSKGFQPVPIAIQPLSQSTPGLGLCWDGLASV